MGGVAVPMSCHRKPMRCPETPDNSLLLSVTGSTQAMRNREGARGILLGQHWGTVENSSQILISGVFYPSLNPLGTARGSRTRKA